VTEAGAVTLSGRKAVGLAAAATAATATTATAKMAATVATAAAATVGVSGGDRGHHGGWMRGNTSAVRAHVQRKHEQEHVFTSTKGISRAHAHSGARDAEISGARVGSGDHKREVPRSYTRTGAAKEATRGFTREYTIRKQSEKEEEEEEEEEEKEGYTRGYTHITGQQSKNDDALDHHQMSPAPASTSAVGAVQGSGFRVHGLGFTV
jgi:hypothetical protein